VIGRLITVSNRLPFSVIRENGRIRVARSSGGLATGLQPAHEESGGVWIGWPGNLEGLAPDETARVAAELAATNAIPVSIPDAEQRVFYDEISNGVLWPICHDRADQLPLHVQGWDEYESVNRRFAETVVAQYSEGDTIWVHDYHLMRLPRLLREMLPKAPIGFFLHVPFPNPEVFFTLPTRHRLVEGMLGADLIGFHTRRWRGHFTAALRRLFAIEMEEDESVHWKGRRVVLGIHPMGVDADRLAGVATRPEVNSIRMAIRDGGQRILLGVDRLDYSKGISRRLTAFALLLRRYPQWRERVRLIQVGVPSRAGLATYDRVRDEIDGLVGRINGEFSTASWSPLRYLQRAIPEEMLVAMFRAADVMLVTPLRDGMNLVCKEFVASRVDEEGVLLLSEFAGAADELKSALIVNPYDVEAMADAMHAALAMPGSERRRRMRALRTSVIEHDVYAWASSFLQSLDRSAAHGARVFALPLEAVAAHA
jgi:trehalose 6-phosphate synthase/phosphatase